MFAITYTLSAGTGLHRANTASDALEVIELLRMGGGVVLKIVGTRTGQQVTLAELQLMARREHPKTGRKETTGPRFPWFRRVRP
jgi:hypothetical protein